MRRTGICRECGYDLPLRKNGYVIQHANPKAVYAICGGSGMRPKGWSHTNG